MRILLSLCILFASCVSPSEDMGAPQSPSATPTFPATITPPANGDALNATTLNTDVETPLQNGVEAARLLTYGGGPRRRVYCSSNTVLVIQPLGAVVATVAGVNTVVPWTTGAATIDPSALSGGLANNTRYWVYATAALSAGAGSPPVFVVSTNAPDAALKYSSASSDQMYVSTFYTDGAASIYKYTQNDNDYTYLGAAVVGGPYLLAGGSATVSAPITIVGGAIPTVASAAELGGLINTSSAGRTATCQGPLTDYWFLFTDNGVAAQPAYAKVAIFAGMGTASYVVSNAGVAFSVAVAGFTL